jgi:hypothetical protein
MHIKRYYSIEKNRYWNSIPEHSTRKKNVYKRNVVYQVSTTNIMKGTFRFWALLVVDGTFFFPNIPVNYLQTP